MSLDLERDLSTGFLQHVRHTSKSGELREGKTRSFVAVRIPDLSPRGGVLGVIRMSSEQVNAFAYQDVEMLRALARQLGVLFDRRQRLDEERRRAQEKQSLFATLIDTSAQPVVAVDSVGRIRVFNRAAREVLGLPVRDDDLPPADRVIGGSVVQLAYGDNRVIAGAVRHAIEAAARGNERLRDYHTVLYRRSRDRSHQLIPVPVRLSASYLLDQETGQPIGSIGIFEDLRASSSIDSICRIQQTCDEYGVTVDPSIAKAIRIITDLPPSSTEPVLITAETGSGKELLVDAIHFRSGRRGEPHKLNCAEVREDMVELFGSVKGAYTGAENLRGIFEEADGGTVFLDEISELSLTAQAKLLIVIGKGRVQPLGATKPRQVDVRVICATNKDLAQLVAQGRFREDLYFRIRGYTFTLPPLRERNPDIMLLADHFLAQERKHLQVNGPLAFASDVVRAFLRYSWPGNVRELQHAVNVAVALWGTNQRDARDRTIRLDHLPLPIREAGSGVQDEAAMRDQVKHLENQVAALEQDLRMARAAPVPAVNNGPGPSSSTQVEPAATTRGRHDVIRGIVLRDRELLRTLLDEKSTRGVNKKVIDQCGENKWTVSRVLKDLRSTYKRMDNVLVNSTSLGGSIRGDQPTTEWILGKLYPRTGRGADKSWVSAAMPALLEHW
ncbi:MAG: sigma 54-interacting transcriptional regulator [Planctomycetota bacterium]